jgi:hypothetical protein
VDESITPAVWLAAAYERKIERRSLSKYLSDGMGGEEMRRGDEERR